jgi:hypothetical protein
VSQGALPEHDAGLISAFTSAQEAAVLEIADQGLASIYRLVLSGAVDIAPQFQRRDRWGPDKQSLLIESFLTNIPVPPVYLAEDAAQLGSYAVIDGKQRLTAIKAFFADELVLRGLARLSGFNGSRFTELPIAIQNSLGMKNLRVTTLLRQSDEELKHEVFLRLNTGGEILNAQEIRNVAYRGPLNNLIYELAENPFLRTQFKVVPPSSPAFRQMTDAEFVLRFFTLTANWRSFKGGLREELDRYMLQRRFDDGPNLLALRKQFAVCMEAAEAIWGAAAFKRPGRDQALAGLYDAQMIALSTMTHDDIRALVARREVVRDLTKDLFDDGEFDEAVRRATNTPARLRFRTERVVASMRTVISRK